MNNNHPYPSPTASSTSSSSSSFGPIPPPPTFGFTTESQSFSRQLHPSSLSTKHSYITTSSPLFFPSPTSSPLIPYNMEQQHHHQQHNQHPPFNHPPPYSYSSPRSHISSTSTMSVVPSPPSSCPSSSAAPFSNNMRYEVILEAPTAAAQKSEDLPLTYLNKGQMYGLSITDAEEFEGDISTTVSIMFHDESHRKVAVDFWKFWLSQQKDPDNARAIDIDTTHSNGVYNIECPYFDGISFRWNGKAGVSINIRFNFLSTDFSRIKGVKGIPLRLHVVSQAVATEPAPLERCYCQIKLFRDKGAERKNKDDARHIEKQLEKLRGKNGEPHPMWLGYLQTQPYTVLCAFASSSPPPLTHPHHLLQQQYHDPYRRFNEHAAVSSLPMTPTTQGVGVKRPYDMAPGSGVSIPPPSSSAALSHTHQQQQPYFMPPTVADMDPSYVPQQRRRTAKLCLFAKLPTEHLHRAIYLEELTVQDLKDKLASKMGHENSSQIKEVVRRVAGKEDVVVQIDDTVVSDMPEEQVMEVETKSNDNDDSLTLMLLY